MREADHTVFIGLLDAVCGLLSRGTYRPSATNAALWFRALAAHDLATVRAAFDRHVADPQRGRFVPVPADILAQIAGAADDDGRPGPEEAWAIALDAADEAETVVWTDDIAQAWNIARPVFGIGDEVGARMAFREAYTRLVAAARSRGERAQWSPSLGFDGDRRRAAIEAAVSAGRLPAAELAALPAPTSAGLALPAPAERSPVAEQARKTLRELADRMRSRAEGGAIDTSERDRLAAVKAAEARRVQAYIAERGATDGAAS